jgi:hypothetical protein
MRGLVLVLFIAALLFTGGGLLVMLTKGFYSTDIGSAIIVGIALVGVGLIPLSGVTVCLAVDEARKDIVAATRAKE